MVLIHKVGNRYLLAANQLLVQYNENFEQEEIIEIQCSQEKVPAAHIDSQIICCLSSSFDGTLIAICTEGKNLFIYTSNLKLLKQIVLKRLPSRMSFTQDNNLVVADRTGDVYFYDLQKESGNAEILLGHLSIVLDIVVSKCGKYIITCDRDEKIRVSQFPNSYNIKSYCLGHKEFVTRLQLCENILISASGDGTVRLWDFVNGNELTCIDTNRHVGNTAVIEDFINEMENENVEATSLPITDLQVALVQNLIIAVSLHRYYKLLIYSVDLSTTKWELLQTIEISKPFSFYLNYNSGALLVLTNSAFIKYAMDSNFKRKSEHSIKKNSVCLDEQYFDNNSFIKSLYKKRFDNVQEYLDRKRLRLETK